jgi:D-glycero-D-manno-heptose 1,7-bisphosphate phosphatase
MLLRASRELGLDLSRSWMVGDTISDLLAGRNAGCRATILVRTGYGARVSKPGDYADHVADDAWSAARLILESGEAERFASNGEQT